MVEEQKLEAYGYATRDPSGFLSPFHFYRRANGEDDITIKILYCGICHSDLHIIKNQHGISKYPIVPGHEIIGVVTQVGCKVKKFKEGDIAGVGCLVGSCGTCDNCLQGVESYCPIPLYTYSIFEIPGQSKQYGGYSDIVVVKDHFAVLIPSGLSLPGCAPLLCAGITVYSPTKHLGFNQEDKNVAVVGLGGLGHVAVKFAKASGAKVTVISTSERKRREAIEELKADSFILSHDIDQMQAAVGTMHGIIDTVHVTHELKPLLDLLRTDGKLVMLGAPDLDKHAELPLLPLLGRKSVTGSSAGGMQETQEMMDFAGKHNITANVEVISMDYAWCWGCSVQVCDRYREHPFQFESEYIVKNKLPECNTSYFDYYSRTKK